MPDKAFAERCRIAQECLPDSPFRQRLTALHDEMLAVIAASATNPRTAFLDGYAAGYETANRHNAVARAPHYIAYEFNGMGSPSENLWNEKQLRDYATQAVLAERERCAKICEEADDGYGGAAIRDQPQTKITPHQP